MVRATGLAPVSACQDATVLKTAVFAFHHARTNGLRGAVFVAPLSCVVVVLEFTSCFEGNPVRTKPARDVLAIYVVSQSVTEQAQSIRPEPSRSRQTCHVPLDNLA